MSRELSIYETNQYINKIFKNLDVFKEKISYLVLRNNIFIDSKFKRCDITGCTLYDNNFVKVFFNNADIISLRITNCKFSNVCFNGTCIDDIDFQNCLFENCEFNNFSMKNCNFNNCEFIEFHPDCCLCELNSYVNCTFINCSFTSSFHYQIFEECIFKNTSIDDLLVGYNYGLLLKQADHEPLYVNYKKLYDYYINNSLYINVFILTINHEYKNNPAVILKWIDFLEIILKNKIIIKSNEILFLKNVISNLDCPPILLYILNKRLISILNTYNIENKKTKDDLILLVNNTYFEFKKKVQLFSSQMDESINAHENYTIEIKYLEKPNLDLCSILNQFGLGYCYQIKTANGSFYEWISCPSNIISCLEIFFMLLNITVPIVYDSIKENRKDKNLKSKNKISVLDLSESTINNVTINVTVNNGCQILNDCNFIENNFQGYNNENIQNVKIYVEK